MPDLIVYWGGAAAYITHLLVAVNIMGLGGVNVAHGNVAVGLFRALHNYDSWQLPADK